MLRVLFMLIWIIAAVPVLADDWGIYANARFGDSIDVPPRLLQGKAPDNDDGRSFRDGTTKLAVWGGNLVGPSFEDAVAADIAMTEADGWVITYQAATPSWASYSGTQGKRVLYQRLIATCAGQYAAFRLEYSTVDITRLAPVVDRLVRTLKGDC